MTAQEYILRAMEPEDFLFIKDCENDPDYWDVSGTRAPWSDYALKQHLLHSGQNLWEEGQLRLIFCKSINPKEAMGILDLFEIDAQHRRASVGIMIAKKHQGSKLAAVALNLLCDYAFHKLHLFQLRADVPIGNMASIKSFESAGFEKSGILKNWLYQGIQGFEDVAIYQKLAMHI